MVDLPLVPVIIIFSELGEYLLIVHLSAKALANSILSTMINGKLSSSAFSTASSFGV